MFSTEWTSQAGRWEWRKTKAVQLTHSSGQCTLTFPRQTEPFHPAGLSWTCLPGPGTGCLWTSGECQPGARVHSQWWSEHHFKYLPTHSPDISHIAKHFLREDIWMLPWVGSCALPRGCGTPHWPARPARRTPATWPACYPSTSLLLTAG